MSEGRSKIDMSVVIPWILSVATVGIGIWQFAVQQTQSNRQPFLQKQLELSFEAVDTAARLASETDPDGWETARKTLWRLYWGPLSIVEDRAVERALVAMGNLVLKSWNVEMPTLQGERREVTDRLISGNNFVTRIPRLAQRSVAFHRPRLGTLRSSAW